MVQSCRGVCGKWKKERCSRQGQNFRRSIVAMRDMALGGFQYGMRVCASITEGIDTGSTHAARSIIRPGSVVRYNLNIPLIRFYLGVDILDTNGFRNQAGFEGESDFDNTRDATGSLTMTKICFNLNLAPASAKTLASGESFDATTLRGWVKHAIGSRTRAVESWRRTGILTDPIRSGLLAPRLKTRARASTSAAC